MSEGRTGASQVVLVVKNPPANARDIKRLRFSPWSGGEDPLENGIAIHSSTLAWRIPWTGAWWVTAHGVAQSGTRLEQLSTHTRGRIWDLNLNEKRMRNRRKKPCCLMETWLFSGFLNLSSVDVMDFLKLPWEGQSLRSGC